MASPTQALRSLVETGTPFIAADCYSALTGRIVERAGFDAAYMGGHATSMMHYAVPDCGVFTPTEMIEQAGRVAEAITIPLIVDADQAGETPPDVYRSVKRYERAGVAGVHIEDEVPPKHSRWEGSLIPIADMQARIAAAAEARRDPAFLLIARSDQLYDVGGGGTGSLDETIRRGIAYAEVGADVYLPTLASQEQLDRIVAEVPIPIAGYGPLLRGVTIALFTGWGVAGAARVHQQLAAHLRQHGDLPSDMPVGFADMDELIDQPLYDRIVESWALRTGRPLRSAE
jgi:2-methylisocitrate lyase-like PEP mutase family enzyme